MEHQVSTKKSKAKNSKKRWSEKHTKGQPAGTCIRGPLRLFQRTPPPKTPRAAQQHQKTIRGHHHQQARSQQCTHLQTETLAVSRSHRISIKEQRMSIHLHTHIVLDSQQRNYPRPSIIRLHHLLNPRLPSHNKLAKP